MFLNFLLLTLLTNGGVFYSIDNLFLRKDANNIVKSIHKFTLANDLNSFNLIYFLFFIYYAFMSLGAVLNHVFDPYWYNFLSVKSALVNSYLCKIYFISRWIDKNFPFLFGMISLFGGIVQVIFQLFMIPLIFTRIGTYFVKWYGLLFFSLSLFALSLSYLPHVEFGIWFIILFPLSRTTIDKRVNVIFDDYCNLCKSTMRKLKYLNFNKSIEFIKLSSSKDIVSKYQINSKLVKSYMVGIFKEKIYIGYDLYILICKLNPLLYFLLPILLFFKYVIPIGPYIYNFIAERRYKIFKQCELDKHDYLNLNKSILLPPVSSRISRMVISGIFVLYFFIHFPFILSKGIEYSGIFRNYAFTSRIMSLFNNRLYRTIAYYGCANIPNVFNSIDLSMGENFFTLYRINENDTILVPIIGEEGQRLNYQNFDILLLTNHNSNILYINLTLRYKRDILRIPDNEKIQYHLDPNLNGFKTIEKLIRIDYNYLGLKGNQKFLVKFYQNNSSSGLKLLEYNPKS